MPRRASSGPNLTVIIGIVVVAAAGFFGIKFLTKGSGKKMTGAQKMKVVDYCENGNSFRGNEYIIEGTVDQRWPRDNGQVLSILDSESDSLIGVKVPANFNSLNIEREQKLAIKVRVQQGGIPEAIEINRL